MILLLPFLGLICAIHGATVQKIITGKVTFNGPKDIQAGSTVEITLQDVSLMDAPAKTLGTFKITDARSFPISYKVKYDLSEIKTGHRYAMSARITGRDGKLHYINDMSITADFSGTKEPTIDIPVIKIGGDSTDTSKKTGTKPCPSLACPHARTCPYGYQKNKDGCTICTCNDPCNPPGKPILCGSKQRCFVEKNSDGTFVGRCRASSTNKNKKGDKNLKAACQEPKPTGMCQAAFPRFYYNPGTKQCEPFVYDGCADGRNNFPTKLACERFCKA